MNVKEVRKIRMSTTILITAVLAITALFIGFQIGRKDAPKNCAELGVAYLEIGKKELGITDFGSEQWNKLVDDETKLTNDCYNSFK